MISLNNLQSGVTQGYFLAKTSIPSGTKQITKAEANTYVNINTSFESYANKASNQLVARQDLQGITNIYPYTIYALADPSGGGGDPYYAWKSIDGGNNFIQLTGFTPSISWTEIAGDVTGTYIAAVSKTLNNQVYISSNSGTTFTNVSLNSANFYPSGVSMSTNGQYIVVSGFSIIPDGTATGYAKIAISSNYGASFTTTYIDTTLHPYWYTAYQSDTGKVSISGNGQYITAVFSYGEFVGFPFNYTRPVGFKVTSSNYGSSFTASATTTYAIFGAIALSETGQYQILGADWYDRNNVFPVGWQEGFRGYVSTNYGATWTQKFEDYDYNNTQGYPTYKLKNLGISNNGSSMVAVNSSSAIFIRYASSDYGANFTRFDGLKDTQGLAVSQTPVSGITNSYVAVFTPGTRFYYSTDGGFNAWYPKEVSAAFFKHIYNKALNTPELPYTYTLYYNYSAGLPEVEGANSASEACDLSANGIIVYTSSSSISVGMPLYYDVYGITQIQANPSSSGSLNYYRIAGYSIQFSNNYVVNSVASCGVAYTTYYADEYVCSGITCAYSVGSVLVVLPSSVTPNYSKFYLLAAGGSTFYQLTSTTTGSGAILATTAYDCLEICGV